MRARPAELVIPEGMLIHEIADKVIAFLGDTSVSKKYVGTRAFHRFYLLDSDWAGWLGLADMNLGWEAWDWWTNNDDIHRSDIGGIALPGVPHCCGWSCDLCNSDPTYLQWRRVGYVDMHLQRYVTFLPCTRMVDKWVDGNWGFMSRWICHDCSTAFLCEDPFPVD